MADEQDAETEKPKKGGKMKKIITGLVLVLILGGGGAAGGYFVAGSMATPEGPVEDPNQPKLVSRDGSEVSLAEATAGAKGKPKFNESAFKATYYSIEAPFTSNLKDSTSFAQMSLAVSTYYDERVLENIQEHETAIRSAVLMTIAEQDSVMLSTQEGKKTLQGLLTTSINKVLEEKTGFGGIDNVYFTSFVVQ